MRYARILILLALIAAVSALSFEYGRNVGLSYALDRYSPVLFQCVKTLYKAIP